MSKGTPLRNVRVPDDVWEAAKARAEAEGTNVSAVVLTALQRFIARPVRPSSQVHSR